MITIRLTLRQFPNPWRIQNYSGICEAHSPALLLIEVALLVQLTGEQFCLMKSASFHFQFKQSFCVSSRMALCGRLEELALKPLTSESFPQHGRLW